MPAGEQEQVILNRLHRCLESVYSDWGVSNLQVAGRGLEFLVCRADSQPFGPIAIKTPWLRWISNDNDANLDARDLLRQEAALTRHLLPCGVTLPAVYALHFSPEIDFLAAEFVESDDSPPDRRQFGRLMRTIHQSPPPQDIALVACSDGALNAVLAERLVRRSHVVADLGRVSLPTPTIAAVQALLDAHPAQRTSLLHMDARPANLLTRSGRIVGIVDWSNALVGDARLELARIAEYGFLSPEFLQGYGPPSLPPSDSFQQAQTDCFAHLPKTVELIYRLDTAVMLGVVFLSEAPDPELARRQVKRIAALYDRLNAAASSDLC